MGDKRKFRIGQPVKVNLNDQLVANYDRGDYRRIARIKHWKGCNVETNDLVLAIVTGVKVFHEGQYHKGSSHRKFYSIDDYHEPAHLSTDNVVSTWAVRIGYKNKEIYFFEEDLVVSESLKMFDQWMCFPVSDIPYFWSGWNSHYRKQMSRESRDWPRDEQGRWAK